MPTTRPRHLIPETDEVARALDDAAREWPEIKDSRTKLLVRLIEQGRRSLDDVESRRLVARREAIRSTAGALSGVYPVDSLERLREDWPE